MSNTPIFKNDFLNLTKVPEAELYIYMEINELAKAITETEEYCGIAIELGFTDGDIVNIQNGKLNYVIAGTHIGDYENYLSIKSIMISYKVTKEEIHKIIQALASLKGNYEDMPNFKGVDLDDDEEVKARSFYTVLTNFEIFEEAIDTITKDLTVEPAIHVLDIKAQVINLRDYINKGLAKKTIVVSENKYIPLVKVEEFNEYLNKADEAIESLVDENPEAAEVLSDVLLKLLKA